MSQPLISAQQLQSARKVLFCSHLALGDFVYLKKCFETFKNKYPHLQVDIWIHEKRSWFKSLIAGVRAISRAAFNTDLKYYPIYDWVESTGLFKHIYKWNFAWRQQRENLFKARQQQYDLIVIINTALPYVLGRIAHSISIKTPIVGVVYKRQKGITRWWRHIAGERHITQQLVINEKHTADKHISEYFAQEWHDLFGLSVADMLKKSAITIPAQWNSYAQLLLYKWMGSQRLNKKVVLISPFGKSFKWGTDRCLRSMTPKYLVSFLAQVTTTTWGSDCFFIIAVEPRYQQLIASLCEQHGYKNVVAFSAGSGFFQLVSVIKVVDVVLTVNTSVLHFAYIFDKPTIVLTPEHNLHWVPLMALKHVVSDKKGVSTISVADVAASLHKILQKISHHLVSSRSDKPSLNL